MLAKKPTLTRVNPSCIVATGEWHVTALSNNKETQATRTFIKQVVHTEPVLWDLTQVQTMDYFGAQIFWIAWGKKLPEKVLLTPKTQKLFNRLQKLGSTPEKSKTRAWGNPFAKLMGFPKVVLGNTRDVLHLVGQLVLDIYRFAKRPRYGPWKEISANIYHAGTQALTIIAIVGFLIGVVLSYLSAQQLHIFGGDIFLVNLLGMSIIRELGPLLAAILVAGRSGSAMTAQIGVMRVTEELNAMQVLGLQHGFRLIMPKIIALAIVMPLLVVWTDIVALFGGMLAGSIQIDLSMQYFIFALPDAVPIANFWIGLIKGVVFGILIALIACYYGIKIKPNTESLGQGTTSSVVASITGVILADAIFAIVFRGVGF